MDSETKFVLGELFDILRESYISEGRPFDDHDLHYIGQLAEYVENNCYYSVDHRQPSNGQKVLVEGNDQPELDVYYMGGRFIQDHPSGDDSGTVLDVTMWRPYR